MGCSLFIFEEAARSGCGRVRSFCFGLTGPGRLCARTASAPNVASFPRLEDRCHPHAPSPAHGRRAASAAAAGRGVGPAAGPAAGFRLVGGAQGAAKGRSEGRVPRRRGVRRLHARCACAACACAHLARMRMRTREFAHIYGKVPRVTYMRHGGLIRVCASAQPARLGKCTRATKPWNSTRRSCTPARRVREAHRLARPWPR